MMSVWAIVGITLTAIFAVSVVVVGVLGALEEWAPSYAPVVFSIKEGPGIQYVTSSESKMDMTPMNDKEGDGPSQDALANAVTPFQNTLPKQFVLHQNEQIRAASEQRTSMNRIIDAKKGKPVAINRLDERKSKNFNINPQLHAKGSFGQNPNLSAVGGRDPATGITVTVPIKSVDNTGDVLETGGSSYDHTVVSKVHSGVSPYGVVHQSSMQGGAPEHPKHLSSPLTAMDDEDESLNLTSPGERQAGQSRLQGLGDHY